MGTELPVQESLPAENVDSLLTSGASAVDLDGALSAGREWYEAAYREGERLGDAAVLARAALGAAGWWLGEQRTAAASALVRARLRHALMLLDPGSPLALRIRLRLAGEDDYRTGEHHTVLEVLDEVRQGSDPLVQAEALRLAHHCLLGPDHGTLRRALADELVGVAGRSAGRGHLLMGLLYQTVDLFLDGDPHAHRRLAELRAELDRGEHLAVGFAASAIDVMRAIRSGHLDAAERLAHECYELGVKAGDVDALAWHSAHLGAIRWYQGRIVDLLPTLSDIVHAPDLSAVDNSFVAAYAVASATAGDQQAAMQALASLLTPSLGDLPRSGSWLVTMYCFVEAAHLIDNKPAAARAYALLRPYANLPVMASLAIACFGSVEHALGLAALTAGDADAAVAHLDRAVRRNLALGHWPAVLQSRIRLAEALERRGDPGDAGAAREERNRAADVATRIAQPAAGTPSSVPAACTRRGRQWRVELGGRAVHVTHGVGMLHLAVLIANPGAEVAALDLVAGVAGLTRAADAGLPGAQPVLDRTATRQYRQRLAELPQESRERDWLVAELTANTRLGGRSRSFTDEAERARLAVGRAVRRALANLERADPVIGAHLRRSVHTGIRCWYRPG